MYQIKKYSFDRAKKLNVIIKPSSKSNYKIDVFDKKNNYITSIGNKNYLDYPSYIEEKGLEYANKRRYLYHLRHKNDNQIKGFFALNILW
jgi:hypothetical protein